MTKRTHSITKVTLIEAFVVGSIIALSWYANTGCATLTEAEKAGIALCKLNQANRDPVQVAVCDSLDAASDWITVASLAAAKPDVSAAKEALIAHPPLSAAANAALALPCIEQPKPIDDANPYYGPQSRVDRRLYPPIVMAPEHEGE